ncbi:hypothetical protein F5X99DRAFT_415737 [Biscogniauxia marginata]|nr:hypothetical protein F5X99DRAFT_415737 [Biscogniauxia marginata]
MKPRRVCDGCRKSHRKCVVQTGETKCELCKEIGRECCFGARYRFRHARRRSEHEGFTLQFESPSRDVSPANAVATSPTPPDISTSLRSSSTSDVPCHMNFEYCSDPPQQLQGRPSFDAYSSISNSQPQSPLTQLSRVTQPPTGHNVASISYILSNSPSTQSSIIEASPTASTVASRTKPRLPRFTEREAFLFRLYILKLAPSSDGCDEARHFALEVPRHALREPMILNGIFALASRYDGLCNKLTYNLESTFYHNRCIELLIEAFSRPPGTWDSTLLTAVVFARLYEEYDNESDCEFVHLSGAQNLLNHDAVARFVTEGGLAEAASWVHLRQAIYVFLICQTPVEMCLDNFRRSTAFRNNDDSARANRMVYHFAKTLQLFFNEEKTAGKDDEAAEQEKWDGLDQDILRWYEGKPISFEPIYEVDADVENGRPFPSIWMVATVPMIAMQHYYAARIIFCLRQLNKAKNYGEFELAKMRRDNERTIECILGRLMGLALCNGEVINSYFLPRHMLSLCGFYIRNPLKREHTIQYLETVYEVTKFKTETLINTLKKEWTELDGFDST